MTTVRTLLAVAAAGLVAALAWSVPATAGGPVTVAAEVNGRAVAGSSDGEPVRVSGGQTRLAVRVTNRGSSTAVVDAVRFEGRVMGLTFFATEASAHMTVPPGATESREIALNTTYVARQAVGLLPGSVSVLDGRRDTIASERLVMDVRGSLRSPYGMFGILVAALTALSFGAGVLALARHRLSGNRWSRGLRFLVPGVGVGLVMVFSLSVFRIYSPQAPRWVAMLAASSSALFLAGYLSPSPGDDAPGVEDPAVDDLLAVAS
jgi:hypothetical protein